MDLVLDFLTSATTLALFSILLFYCLFLYRSYKVSHSKEDPIVQGAWPILGHLPLLRSSQSPHRTLGALADKYGPLFTIKIGSKRALVLSNWEMAKECFTKIDLAISTRPKGEAYKHMTYNGAFLGFAPNGSYYREIRKIATSEMLTNRRVEQQQHFHILEVQRWIKELFDVWFSKKNESSNYVLVEMKQWLTQLSFNIVLPMLVGKQYFGHPTNVINEEEGQRCVKALKKLMHLLGVFTIGDAIPLLKWFDFGGHVKAMKATSKELDKILGDLLEEHRHKRSLGAKEVDRNHQDFMDVMLSLFDGTTIEGFDSDTIIKATVLVCTY
ncbi:putative cytochrome P450 [Medicago truncatula]|uniref:Putative cytochrome P450 n=1 Tax=Medicago truncatula TaxID=3880 RepID=A0A396HBJ5_MEDTR|nr:putative cytochrome P450 [Medicago truncatula]